MKTIPKPFIAAVIVTLGVLLGYLFIDDHRDNNGIEPSVTMRDGTTDTTVDEAPTPQTNRMLAKMTERYGDHYAVYDMNPEDVGEGERLHLGVYLIKGNTKKELGVTSLGQESYRNKELLAVAITDGSARIERWGNDGNHTGNAWTLEDEARKECESLDWSDGNRQRLKLGQAGHRFDLGTTRGGWKLMVEFERFEPKVKDA